MTIPDTSVLENQEAVQVGLKAYLNSFPKAGTHLVNLMLATLCSPVLGIGGVFTNKGEKNWAGSVTMGGWGDSEIENTDRMRIIFGEMPQGTYIKGHSVYTKETEASLLQNGIATMFLYRDPRDIAVSQAFHIMNEDDIKFCHPGKEIYRALPDFEHVLIAVIEGIGEFPGLFDRWEKFAPWFDVDWVIKLRYEDLISDPYIQSVRLITYLYTFLGLQYGVNLEINQEDLKAAAEAMVSAMGRTDLSPTFRKGGSGGWRNYFTKPVRGAFEKCSGNWLERLGYKW